MVQLTQSTKSVSEKNIKRNWHLIDVKGKKANTKLYTSYSGYPGGLKSIRFEDLLKKNPDKVIRHAVSGMLPKNKLRDKRLARLFIFPDEKHTYKDKILN